MSSPGRARERALPHAPDAERALLGSMLLEQTAIGEAITILKDAGSSAFFFPKHQKLYDHIVELYDENKAIDGVVIKDELDRRGLFDELGGYDFLADLVNAVPSALRVRHYAEIVREKHLLRELIGATHRVMDTAYEDGRPPAEILDYAEQEVFGVTERRVSSSPETLLEQIDALFKKIEDKQPHTGEETGFFELDDLLCGLQPSELIIVAGRPSMGKTALGLNMAENLALTQGKPTLFFSLEMSRQQVAQRILCSRARVNSHRLRRGRVTDQDLERLKDAADEISGRPLFVDDSSSLSILELRARARMAYRKHSVKAIFVDYLQLMHARGWETRQAEVAEISRGLKALAKELNVPIVAMAQLNRNPEDRTGNRPRMSDLRESGAIEQDADVVMLLHRESYYKTNRAVDDALQGGVGGGPQAAQTPEDTTAELIIAKQRNGPVGTIKLHFSKQWTRFDNHKPGQEYETVREAQYFDDDVQFP